MSNAQALTRAEMLFARKEKQEKHRTEGVLATTDYRQAQEHQLANLARLRVLRAERDARVQLPPSSKPKSKRHTRTRTRRGA